jgi:hypothetical protein
VRSTHHTVCRLHYTHSSMDLIPLAWTDSASDWMHSASAAAAPALLALQPLTMVAYKLSQLLRPTFLKCFTGFPFAGVPRGQTTSSVPTLQFLPNPLAKLDGRDAVVDGARNVEATVISIGRKANEGARGERGLGERGEEAHLVWTCCADRISCKIESKILLLNQLRCLH